MGTKKTPTAEAVAESKALRAIYAQQVADDITQAQFGEQAGIGTAGMVWQYLHGYRPLNLEAACKFAHALNCRIDDFSPRIAKSVRAALSLMAPSPSDFAAEGEVTQEEAELLRAYRALSQKDRNSLRRQAIALSLMAVEPATNERVASAYTPPAAPRKTARRKTI